jgi:hypothetical protein
VASATRTYRVERRYRRREIGYFSGHRHNDYRLLRELFQHSMRTIQRAFHEVLGLLCKRLYRQVVRPADNIIPEVIKDNRGRSPFFDDCRGAVDGTHIIASSANNFSPVRYPYSEDISRIISD